MGSSQHRGAPTTLNVSGHKHTWTIYIYLRKKYEDFTTKKKINFTMISIDLN